MTDKEDDIRNFLESIPDQFAILEEGIDIQTQMEYLDYSHSFDQGELSEERIIKLGNLLFDTRTKKDAKKKILTLLAHLGTITAFRQIEKYFKTSDNELRKWTALSLQECKMFLESSLIEEFTGFISSGLGGTKDKLRFFFLVLSLTDQPFTSTQHNVIKEEFLLLSKELKCTIETVVNSENYVGLTILVPMDVAVGIFIEKGIKKCNELGDFVFEYYFATNQEIPNDLEIIEIIKKVREG